MPLTLGGGGVLSGVVELTSRVTSSVTTWVTDSTCTTWLIMNHHGVTHHGVTYHGVTHHGVTHHGVTHHGVFQGSTGYDSHWT